MYWAADATKSHPLLNLLAVSNHILICIDGKPCLSNPALLFAVISRSKILEAHVTHVQLYAHLALEFWAGEPDFGTCAKN